MSLACMRCGQVGHLVKDCTLPPSCNNCGGRGHMAKSCPSIRCDRCGRAGHMARECTKGGAMRCYECGENGHVSKDCPVAEKRRRNNKPLDPDVRRKDNEKNQFHRARGQMMTYNNLATHLPVKPHPLKPKRAHDANESDTKKLKVGMLRSVTVIKPKGSANAAALQ
eukprot:CAMPEP_0179438534 /NCGR_PEP_ID=MMETSP0799-20121207/22258_1 /TAXON_ID=46947 /ORGANISM="Geminigera cryophila, Strain CCMP2564" /LENGTH=166 /DNA_ID=CAMNT_0021220229 /DNA_START=61 /DNA_END=558 /DNA_ORIENTATION=-